MPVLIAAEGIRIVRISPIPRFIGGVTRDGLQAAATRIPLPTGVQFRRGPPTSMSRGRCDRRFEELSRGRQVPGRLIILTRQTHFFSPAVQFSTTVIGEGDASPLCVLTRNR